MKTFMNYLGQLRLYSVADLALLLVAAKASPENFTGALILHVGFLAFLESRHSDNGRLSTPRWVWVPICLLGIVLYPTLGGMLFLVSGLLYTRKKIGAWGLFAPVFRGLQHFFIVSGITGYVVALPYIAFLVLVVRNIIADLRDVTKDRREGVVTWPVSLGFGKDVKHVHFLAVVSSTIIWWHFTDLPAGILVGVIVLQFATYNLTPR